MHPTTRMTPVNDGSLIIFFAVQLVPVATYSEESQSPLSAAHGGLTEAMPNEPSFPDFLLPCKKHTKKY